MNTAALLSDRTVVHHPATISQSLELLAQHGEMAKVLAGGTWLMRDGMAARHYVSLSRIEALRQIEFGPQGQLRIGAAVTHEDLALALEDRAEFLGLAEAAGQAANPAIRRRATMGGNLCCAHFAAADLPPVLLAAKATVVLATASGEKSMAVGSYLHWRESADALNHLLMHVDIPRAEGRILAHTRLPLRKAGDYPVAIVSLAARVDAQGRLADVAVAVGAVEDRARRWRAVEEALEGRRPGRPDVPEGLPQHLDDFAGREGPEVPAWYRQQVLPELLARALTKWQQAAGLAT